MRLASATHRPGRRWNATSPSVRRAGNPVSRRGNFRVCSTSDFQESERLQRLWTHLDAEPRRVRWLESPFVRRTAAIAAAVLLTLGLSSLLGSVAQVPPDGQLTARLDPAGKRFAAGPLTAREGVTSKAASVSPHAEMDAAAVLAYPLELQGKTPTEFRSELRRAGPEHLPPPPTVDLVLEIHNGGREVLPLRVGGEGTELTLELQGPGAISVPAGRHARFRSWEGCGWPQANSSGCRSAAWPTVPRGSALRLLDRAGRVHADDHPSRASADESVGR